MSDFDDFIDGFYPYRKQTVTYRRVPDEPRDRAEVLAELPGRQQVAARPAHITTIEIAAAGRQTGWKPVGEGDGLSPQPASAGFAWARPDFNRGAGCRNKFWTFISVTGKAQACAKPVTLQA